jgi:hypothetical protein
MSESTLSRVVTATSARDVWVTFCKLDVGKHAGTSIEEHFNGFSTVLLEEQRPM